MSVYLLARNKPCTKSNCNVNDVEPASLSKVGIAILFRAMGKWEKLINFGGHLSKKECEFL
jgi:hypothetical protein